jgi:hypothetical protein
MIGNMSKVQERLSVYVAAPYKRFEANSELSTEEQAVKQKVRQYWADESLSNIKKLQGLNLDLAGFDPTRTNNKQLREIGAVLAERGFIDEGLVDAMSSIDIEFDADGKEINMEREVNAYAFFEKELAALHDLMNRENDVAKDGLVELKTVISVVMALAEYANTPREHSLVNIRA